MTHCMSYVTHDKYFLSLALSLPLPLPTIHPHAQVWMMNFEFDTRFIVYELEKIKSAVAPRNLQNVHHGLARDRHT
jgi:hypothetical protein